MLHLGEELPGVKRSHKNVNSRKQRAYHRPRAYHAPQEYHKRRSYRQGLRNYSGLVKTNLLLPLSRLPPWFIVFLQKFPIKVLDGLREGAQPSKRNTEYKRLSLRITNWQPEMIGTFIHSAAFRPAPVLPQNHSLNKLRA